MPPPTAEPAAVIECPNGAVVFDETKLVESCAVGILTYETVAVSASNIGADLNRMRITWAAGPNAGYTFRLQSAGDHFSLDYTGVSGGFAALVSHEIDLSLRAPVDASQVDVTWRGQPLRSNTLDCQPRDDDPASGGFALVHDYTGVVESCEAVETRTASEEITVANVGHDRFVLRVLWADGFCDKPFVFEMKAASYGYSLDGHRDPAVCLSIFADAQYEIRLQLWVPVDASAVAVTLTYPQPSPRP